MPLSLILAVASSEPSRTPGASGIGPPQAVERDWSEYTPDPGWVRSDRPYFVCSARTEDASSTGRCNSGRQSSSWRFISQRFAGSRVEPKRDRIQIRLGVGRRRGTTVRALIEGGQQPGQMAKDLATEAHLYFDESQARVLGPGVFLGPPRPACLATGSRQDMFPLFS